EKLKNEGIAILQNSSLPSVPMDYDPLYTQDNKQWHSIIFEAKTVRAWFTQDDITQLVNQGITLYCYLATEYIHYEMETCFIKQTCLRKEKLNPYIFWQ